MYGLLIILLLALLGAVIAYVGDKLGMKVGKKRLSLFGLRPRYTALLITICTGVLIAVLSLGFLLTISYRFRQALFDLESLLVEVRNLEGEVEAKNSQLSELEADIYQLQGQKEDLNRRIGNLTHNLTLFGRGYFQGLTGELLYGKEEVVAARRFSGDRKSSKEELTSWLLEVEAASRVESLSYSSRDFEQVLDFIGGGEPSFLQLRAAQNVFPGDKLRVRFDLYEDYQVYKVGEEIITFEVEAGHLQEAVDELEKELHQAALEVGMIAHKNGQGAGLKLDDLYPLLEQLARAEEKVKVEVRAQEEVYRSDRLGTKLSFKVWEQ